MIATFAVLLLTAHTSSAQQIDTLALHAHTRFLADDLLEGRGTGTRGERLAASYISAQLEALGIPPASDNGYLLPFVARRGSTELPSANVAALVIGGDSLLRGEVVALTAHYDHIGIGRPTEQGDSIYNGFSDNAAGVAMLLAIAAELQRDPPARSVLFLFFSGEELGLQGSIAYVKQPVIPLERMVAVINLDGGAPPAPPVNWRIAGGTASTLGALAKEIAEVRGWRAELSAGRPNSDHWPFLARGVPAVFIIPRRDWEGLSEDEERVLFQRWDRYHHPDDEWSPGFPWAGVQRYAEFALALGRAAAEAPERPRMLPSIER